MEFLLFQVFVVGLNVLCLPVPVHSTVLKGRQEFLSCFCWGIFACSKLPGSEGHRSRGSRRDIDPEVENSSVSSTALISSSVSWLSGAYTLQPQVYCHQSFPIFFCVLVPLCPSFVNNPVCLYP